MARKSLYPEYHRALMDRAAYPSATRRVKFEETAYSYLFRTGDHVYKIRKTSHLYPNLAIKERFAQEALRLGQRWAPDVVQAVVPVVQLPEGGYAVAREGTPVEYALQMVQLSENHWLHKLIPPGKVTATAWGRLARYLAQHHELPEGAERPAEGGRPEHFRGLADEVFYQAKKYLQLTISDAMLEMVSRPVYRFLDDARKLFLRRQKKGRVVDCHGAFVPWHIHLRGSDICAIAPLEAQRKFRIMDAANDVATLVNELARQGATEAAELFVRRYVSAAKDRELMRMLPLYQTLQAMRSGLVYSERMAERPVDDPVRQEAYGTGRAYFNLAVQAAREIPRDL